MKNKKIFLCVSLILISVFFISSKLLCDTEVYTKNDTSFTRIPFKVVSVLKSEDEYPANDFSKYQDTIYFQNYVDKEKFLELKDSVNQKVLNSLHNPDAKPRVEKKIRNTIALRGTIVTPSEIIDDGYIMIKYKSDRIGNLEHVYGIITKVESYSEKKIPKNVKLVDFSGNYIFPGFIDLHNHINYSVYDLWLPSYDIYPNRNVWPNDPRYKDWKKMHYYLYDYKNLKVETAKYGEIRALLGGATMSQGYSSNQSGNYGLIRNVENKGNLLGVDVINQSVLPINMWWSGNEERTEEKRAGIIYGFNKGKTKRFIIHFCEGIDEKIHIEYEKMIEYNLLRSEFIGIHSTALGNDDWNNIAKSGMKIVWSPLSNLIMYNRTMDIKGALDHGVPFQYISLAPDWGPSGSPNILFEAKVAEEYNIRRLDGMLTPKNILSLITENPAIITTYDSFVGTIKEGLRADLTIIKKCDADPYISMLISDIENINLVMVDGQPLYGSLNYYKNFDKGNDYEIFEVNGIEKAIDITDTGLDKGTQTLKELFNLFNREFEEMKKVIPFEFKDDINRYCKLSALYWPKPTSFDNLIFESLLGKTSKYGVYKSYLPFELNKKRDTEAANKFSEFKKENKKSKKFKKEKIKQQQQNKNENEESEESDEEE